MAEEEEKSVDEMMSEVRLLELQGKRMQKLVEQGGNSIGLNLSPKRLPKYAPKVDRFKTVYHRYLLKAMGHPNMRPSRHPKSHPIFLNPLNCHPEEAGEGRYGAGECEDEEAAELPGADGGGERRGGADFKDINHKQDFRKGTVVTLKRKCFS